MVGEETSHAVLQTGIIVTFCSYTEFTFVGWNGERLLELRSVEVLWQENQSKEEDH